MCPGLLKATYDPATPYDLLFAGFFLLFLFSSPAMKSLFLFNTVLLTGSKLRVCNGIPSRFIPLPIYLHKKWKA